MLPYARRIVFQPEYQQIPTFTLRTLYREQPKRDLLNNKGQFFVHLDEKTPYLREFVRQAQDLGLTVSGDGTALVKGGDITNAKKGDIITVGSSSRFDVNWAKRDGYVCSKGYAPVYEASKDWNKIEKALKQFADQKKSFNDLNGTNIRFHSNFMVVDGRVVRYDRDEIAVLMPAKTLRDLVCEYELVAIKVVRY